MPQKPKARGSAGKVKSKSAGSGAAQKSQSERFIETARIIGVDETGGEFDRALEKVVPTRRKSSS